MCEREERGRGGRQRKQRSIRNPIVAPAAARSVVARGIPASSLATREESITPEARMPLLLRKEDGVAASAPVSSSSSSPLPLSPSSPSSPPTLPNERALERCCRLCFLCFATAALRAAGSRTGRSAAPPPSSSSSSSAATAALRRNCRLPLFIVLEKCEKGKGEHDHSRRISKQ